MCQIPSWHGRWITNGEGRELLGALEGVRVLDLSRVLAGPLCTMILGDLGADIIKVEAPGGSDDTRTWGPPFKEGVSAYYLCANRNKKSITVNLKTDEGIRIIKKLVRESDVVVNNFKVGTMERLGLGYEVLKEVNPGIVYCSITGFGESGPYKDLPGYDYIIQAMSGLMSITGTDESGPQKVGVAITDILTGLYACIGIQAALLEKEQSGVGQSVDISLFDAGISALVNIASNYLMSGKIPQRLGNTHANIVPYQMFSTADGEMVIAIGNDRQFAVFCSLIGKEELASDPRFQTNASRVANRQLLIPILQEVLAQKATADWQQLCHQHGIPCGPINNLQQLFQDPQVQAREMVVTSEHPVAGEIKLVGSPLKLSKNPVQVRHHPPSPGEHTASLLSKLGYTEQEIKSLQANQTI
ncbi:crotonobetainyl-CoA:carnitine CoA-transferase CaiB-like acyl-CoA transferase [Bacillus chungangensis]|uniref:Crotonobetainyl-CoA:carnitine CoA-transferase CaiB-like acyl-CoA transferase n=1 Tax=Bacillus chungangensis TaxID=587633 RepID=A0ABT9WRI0_9BACI|nr:crotonobetainyl-CoA:carnitine CoA-transferase CaiB-like acyl-CoA transferase [Bacillus chungangensis]